MDLNAPLGMTPPPKPKRSFALYFGMSVGAIIVIAVGFTLAFSDPQAGEPTAVATVPPIGQPSQRTTDLALAGISILKPSAEAEQNRDGATDRTPTGSLHSPPGSQGEAPTLEHGVKVYRSPPPGAAIASTSTGPLIIDVSRALDDPQHRPSSGGTRSNGEAPAPANAGPRIAIFVSGMGLDESATRTAIEVMPSPITLAFLPYGEALAALVDAAKTRGHEVLLQLPMQSGRQGAALGPTQRPHSLMVGRDGAKMAEDLDWLLARFSGYDGVTNLLGASVSSDTSTMTAVLKAVGGRHLFYLDDGTSKQSAAVSVGATLGVPTIQADLVLDATADPSVVHANLEALVAIARRKGSAIGMASGLPDHLAAIARFASELRGQGITLVPVNALAGGPNAAPTTTSTR